MLTHKLYCGDNAKLPFEDDSFDLVFASPPYGKARRYGELSFPYKGDAWVEWAIPRYAECLRVCRGVVCWVVGVTTDNFEVTPYPAMLQAEIRKRKIGFLRNPPIFHRFGISGSGGPDWLRADYETVVCATRKRGKLPWSDNTAMGGPPKYAPGGAMSHHTADGRVNEKPRKKAYVPPEKVNPGNVIHRKVGGGHMGHELAHGNEACFPETLADFFIRSFCPPGGQVLDVFNGSGSTMAAAHKAGRNSMGVEIRHSQCWLAFRRLLDIGVEFDGEPRSFDGGIFDAIANSAAEKAILKFKDAA